MTRLANRIVATPARPCVGRITYKNGMTLFVDYDPRKFLDHYVLLDSRGKEIFRRSLPKLETWHLPCKTA